MTYYFNIWIPAVWDMKYLLRRSTKNNQGISKFKLNFVAIPLDCQKELLKKNKKNPTFKVSKKYKDFVSDVIFKLFYVYNYLLSFLRELLLNIKAVDLWLFDFNIFYLQSFLDFIIFICVFSKMTFICLTSFL